MNRLTLTAVFMIGAWLVVRAQVPPMPVATTDTGPNVLTNHVCPARLPVIWISWKAPTNWVPTSYRIYSHTNPLAKPSSFKWYATIPATRTNLVVHTVGDAQVFYVVAVDMFGNETKFP